MLLGAIRKDLQLLLRDRGALITMFLLPIVFIAVFGVIFGGDGDDARGTTTLESKTNFLSPAKAGAIVTGEATPVHSGKRTSVWQTKITGEDGKAIALVTQTPLVLS